MEPQLPAPNISPEMGAPHQSELPPTPEAQPVRAERAPEAPAAPETQPAGPAASVPALPVPTLPQAQAQPAAPVLTPVPVTNTNPVTASDEDVIEKEWVDKAKKIVAQTKDDPYRQEKEVSKLQADYLKKRYGKEVKLLSD